jgi:hypothetical protein
VIAAAWAWGLLAVLVFLGLGVLLMLLLGLAGAPGDFLRRLGQRAAPPREEQGHVIPDEVPTATVDDAPDA